MADSRHITRRTLVKAIPFIGIVAATPVLANAISPDAEILAAYAEWARLYDLAAQEDGDEHFAGLNAAEISLINLTAHTPRGLAIQLLAFTNFGDFATLTASFFDFGEKLVELASVQEPSSRILPMAV